VFAGLILVHFDIVPIPSPSLEPEWESDAGIPDRVIGLWLAGGLLAQILGALFKAPALRHRLFQRRQAPGKGFTLLWWVHFLFFTFLATFSLGLLGWDFPKTDEITGPYMLWGITVFTIGGITTLAVRWAGKPGEEARPRPPARPGFEYLGDFLLFVSVLILTRVIWDPMAALFTPPEIGVPMRVVLLVCGLVLFVFFYLPPRLLFLVEDGHYGRTWAQITGIALAPLLWHVFFG
jgi:hypothetical protein